MQSEKEALIEEYTAAAFKHKDAQLPMYVWRQHFVEFADKLAALSAAEPVSSRNDEAGYVEFLNEDVPYIVRDIQGSVAILMDLETRNVVGYRVYDPDSVFAPHSTTDGHKPLQGGIDIKPVAWVYAADLEKGDGCFGNAKGEVCMSRDGKWVKADTPLYAAPPAPSVAVKVKSLEWKEGNPGSYTEIAESPFGHYSVWEINGTGCWSPWRQGSGSIVDGGLAGAKSAAQADYEARIRSALSAQVQDVAVDDEHVKAAFNHGYVIACCNVTNLHDEPGIAHDTLRELGISKAEVKRMGLCDYDAKALREIERARGPNSSLYAAAPAKQEARE